MNKKNIYLTVLGLIILALLSWLLISGYIKKNISNPEQNKTGESNQQQFSQTYKNFGFDLVGDSDLIKSLNCNQSLLQEISDKKNNWGLFCRSDKKNNMFLMVGWRRISAPYMQVQEGIGNTFLNIRKISEVSNLNCVKPDLGNYDVICSLNDLKNPINYAIEYINIPNRNDIEAFILVSDIEKSVPENVKTEMNKIINSIVK